MISAISFHPFISHFPPALFVAGLILIFLAHKRKNEKLKAAGSFNLSLGLLASVTADFSGMVSVDINLLPLLDIEGHQGYSFLYTIIYGFATGYSYTNAFCKTAWIFYGSGIVSMFFCIFSGYQLVF
tara:strand:+ start:647 stop:1027 length:381 start_codon:yes stop_codon:yes gene_type:complete